MNNAKTTEWKIENSSLGQILEQCITHTHRELENFIHIKLSIIYAHGCYKYCNWFNSTDMGKKYILDLI